MIVFLSNSNILPEFRLHIFVTVSYLVREALIYLLSDFISYQSMINLFILTSIFCLQSMLTMLLGLLFCFVSISLLQLCLFLYYPLFHYVKCWVIWGNRKQLDCAFLDLTSFYLALSESSVFGWPILCKFVFLCLYWLMPSIYLSMILALLSELN